MAVSVRVGNTLGEGNPVRAKRIACVAMVIGGKVFCLVFLLFCFLLLINWSFGTQG